MQCADLKFIEYFPHCITQVYYDRGGKLLALIINVAAVMKQSVAVWLTISCPYRRCELRFKGVDLGNSWSNIDMVHFCAGLPGQVVLHMLRVDEVVRYIAYDAYIECYVKSRTWLPYFVKKLGVYRTSWTSNPTYITCGQSGRIYSLSPVYWVLCVIKDMIAIFSETVGSVHT